MRLEHLLARRYLFSRKKAQAINIISAITVVGIAFGTAALVCVLSVFNGFHDLIGGLYTTFNPELRVTAAHGKFVEANDARLLKIAAQPEVAAAARTLEDNALILFQGHPLVITLKGVDDEFTHVCALDSILYGNGRYRLSQAGIEFGIPGIGLAQSMGGLDFGTLQICAPRAGERINLANPVQSFNVQDITSTGLCFNVRQQTYDQNYLLTSLTFAQTLFAQSGRITALELRLRPGADTEAVKARMRAIGGADLRVSDRLEQQEDMFRAMNIEKLTTYLFLTFILVIVFFNVVGSVSMLIIDKRDDAQTLRVLGASRSLLRRVFRTEGFLITLLGLIVGLTLGLTLCWLQQDFGLIGMGGGAGAFIIDAYPVSIHLLDIPLVIATVLLLGFLSVWWPVSLFFRDGGKASFKHPARKLDHALKAAHKEPLHEANDIDDLMKGLQE